MCICDMRLECFCVDLSSWEFEKSFLFGHLILIFKTIEFHWNCVVRPAFHLFSVKLLSINFCGWTSWLAPLEIPQLCAVVGPFGRMPFWNEANYLSHPLKRAHKPKRKRGQRRPLTWPGPLLCTLQCFNCLPSTFLWHVPNKSII